MGSQTSISAEAAPLGTLTVRNSYPFCQMRSGFRGVSGPDTQKVVLNVAPNLRSQVAPEIAKERLDQTAELEDHLDRIVSEWERLIAEVSVIAVSWLVCFR
jgi:hypothetical protein